MPRNYKSTERYLAGDPRHGNRLVTKFANSVMRDGKKSTAQRVVYDAFEIIQGRMKDKDPVEVFTQAVSNVKPLIQVRSKRVGGATYQVPMEVSKRRAQMLAIRWLLEAARGKKGRPIARALADELIAAFNGEGGAMTTRENVHKMAEANKAFAHFAW
jgi:small subunit ribosomal protein S7